MDTGNTTPPAEPRSEDIPAHSYSKGLDHPLFIFNISLFSCAIQFAVHAWWQFQSGNPFSIMPRLVSWFHDCILIYFIYITGNAFFATTRTLPRRPFSIFLPAAAWFASICLLMFYPRHVPDFLNFPVNIFTVDMGAAKQFSRQFIAWNEIVIIPSMTLLLFVFVYLRKPFAMPSVNIFLKAAVFILAAVTLAAPSPNPLVFSAQDSLVSMISGGGRQFQLLTRPHISTSMKNRAANASSLSGMEAFMAKYPASSRQGDLVASKEISHAVVIVMETVEGSRFTREILENKNSFMGSRRGDFRYFSNYFTTNLDSYTSLVAMMTSVFVPFMAYSDPEIYSGVQNAPNLAAAMKKNGAFCSFISTAADQPFVPVKNEWDRVLARRDIPTGEAMAHIDSPPIESAVEDRAARPAIIDIMQKNPRSFIVQECVFGHTEAWLDLTKKTQLEYYDLYMRELTDSIKAAGLLDNTLLILVADHGSRRDPAEFDNYRVPLIMRGPGVISGDDGRFLSHLDFSGLVREAFSGKRSGDVNDRILTAGHSGKWVYGEIRSDGKYQFLDNSRGRALGQKGGLDPASLQNAFQLYLDLFLKAFPDPRTSK